MQKSPDEIHKKNKKSNYLIVIIFSICLLLITFRPSLTNSHVKTCDDTQANLRISVIHPLIEINGDEELIAFPNKTGAGTLADPYLIEDLEIHSGGSRGIYIYDTRLYLTIKNCTIHGPAGGRGIAFDNCSNIQVDTCTIKHVEYGVYVETSSNILIIGNQISNCTEYGICLHHADYNNLTSNVVFNTGDNGIHLFYSDYCFVSENILTNSGENGIRLYNVHNDQLLGNTISNSQYRGIALAHSEYNTLKDNQISNSDDYGLNLHFSDNNTIIRNKISNTIKEDGMYISSSDNNKIIFNFISNSNDYAIEMMGTSANNSVYLNKLTGSGGTGYEVNFWSTAAGNTWDTTILGILNLGNYWGDYQDHYPGAVCNGLIWNMAYQFHLTHKDNYPLCLDIFLDLDLDGLLTGDEILFYGTEYNNSDTDMDGLNDSAEINIYQTNATNMDTDADGLNDSAEINIYQTNATNIDTDADGFNDSYEIESGTNPNDPSSNPQSPGGGIPGFQLIYLACGFIVIVACATKYLKKHITEVKFYTGN